MIVREDLSWRCSNDGEQRIRRFTYVCSDKRVRHTLFVYDVRLSFLSHLEVKKKIGENTDTVIAETPTRANNRKTL